MYALVERHHDHRAEDFVLHSRLQRRNLHVRHGVAGTVGRPAGAGVGGGQPDGDVPASGVEFPACTRR